MQHKRMDSQRRSIEAGENRSPQSLRISTMRLSPASPIVALAIATTITLVGGIAVHRAMAAPSARVAAITTLPSLGGASTWLNSTELTSESLKGKVVAIDFWTFLCSNCQAALPFVRKLDADFRSQGLVTIGVHTPELAPERDLANVKKAIVKLGVQYPVAVDPDFTIWNRFGNRYWPSIYLFDKQGKLRYHYDGEGDYAKQREVVAQLLAEK